MLVHFIPSKTGPLREFRSESVECLKEGDYEVADDVGEQLISDYPDNFSQAGGAKAAGKPPKNRAAPEPERNK